MDQVTQQNAALVEEASAAAHSLQEQAANLSHAVSVFKLDDSARAVPAFTRVTPLAATGPKAKAAPKRPPVKAPGKIEARSGPQLAMTSSAADDWTAF